MSVQAIFRPNPYGGFWVEVPSLPGCVTWGETRDEALENAYERVMRAVEAYRAMGEPIPWQPERAEIPAGATVESLEAAWDEPVPIDLKALEEAEAAFDRGEGIDMVDVLRELGVDVRRPEPPA